MMQQKHWAGLAAGYFLSRWELFFNFSRETCCRGIDFPQQTWVDFEIAFCEKFDRDGSTSFPTETVGDTEVESIRLQAIYGGSYLSPHRYDSLYGTDAIAACGLSSVPAWTDSTAQLKYLCDSECACVGFSSTGFFKSCTETYNSVGSILMLKIFKMYQSL